MSHQRDLSEKCIQTSDMDRLISEAAEALAKAWVDRAEKAFIAAGGSWEKALTEEGWGEAMKLVTCSYHGCGGRRLRWDDPHTERGPQHVPVEDDHDGPVYCSIECAVYDGKLKHS